MATTSQPTAVPTRKWQAGAFYGGLAAIGMGLIAIFEPEAYARVPPGFEAGVAVVLAKIAEYWTKERA